MNGYPQGLQLLSQRQMHSILSLTNKNVKKTQSKYIHLLHHVYCEITNQIVVLSLKHFCF